MQVSLIAAVSRKGIIADRDRGIPWELPEDIAHFRRFTRGKWMLLGRSTYEEMEGWFIDQVPLVLSRYRQGSLEGSGRWVGSPREAIRVAAQNGAAELVVSGGASVYRDALLHVSRLVITWIDYCEEVESPIRFPEIDWSEWDVVLRDPWPADEANIYSMEFAEYTRKRGWKSPAM